MGSSFLPITPPLLASGDKWLASAFQHCGGVRFVFGWVLDLSTCATSAAPRIILGAASV